MKFPPFLFLALIFSLLPVAGRAQAGGAPLVPGARKVPVRNFAVCFLYAPTVPELYYRDAKGDYARLQVDTVRFSSWNAIPDAPTLEVFRKKVTPEARTADPASGRQLVTPGIVTYEPMQTWTLPPGKDSLRRLYHYDAGGKVRIFDWVVSAGSHGPLQALTINLLNEPVAIRMGSQESMVGAGQRQILTAASAPGESFSFKYGFQGADSAPFISPQKLLSFRRPQQRLTILISYLPVTTANEDSPAGGITRFLAQDLRFYEDTDRLPGPPEPVIVYPRSVALR